MSAGVAPTSGPAVPGEGRVRPGRRHRGWQEFTLVVLVVCLAALSVGVWATNRWGYVSLIVNVPVASGRHIRVVAGTPGPRYDPIDLLRLYPQPPVGPVQLDLWYQERGGRISRLTSVGLPAWPLGLLTACMLLTLAVFHAYRRRYDAARR